MHYLIYINRIYATCIIYIIYISFIYITYIIYINLICMTYVVYIINTIYRCSTSTSLRPNSYSVICREVIRQELLYTQQLIHRS